MSNPVLEQIARQRVADALDHLAAAHSALLDAQAASPAAQPVADMLRGVNEALAAHLVAELRR